MPTATKPASLRELHAALTADGFTPGIPGRVTGDTRATDRCLCRRLRCPRCRARALTYRPYTDGQRYRVLACCRTCNAAEEV
ncbi:MAG TPA: hypothetical protein VKA46_00300 [Gemmataceae bacterium]|nr:hypothetical protein [Gemmataceae bacterium]